MEDTEQQNAVEQPTNQIEAPLSTTGGNGSGDPIGIDDINVNDISLSLTFTLDNPPAVDTTIDVSIQEANVFVSALLYNIVALENQSVTFKRPADVNRISVEGIAEASIKIFHSVTWHYHIPLKAGIKTPTLTIPTYFQPGYYLLTVTGHDGQGNATASLSKTFKV